MSFSYSLEDYKGAESARKEERLTERQNSLQ